MTKSVSKTGGVKPLNVQKTSWEPEREGQLGALKIDFCFKKINRYLRATCIEDITRRNRKIRTALRTNQIAGFVTVPFRKKINEFYVLSDKNNSSRVSTTNE